MGKETRIGVGVVGVLLAISLAVLYGRLTRDAGPRIDVRIDAVDDQRQGGNQVPRQPTIEQDGGARFPNVSPATESLAPRPGDTPAKSFLLPDPDHVNPSDGGRELSIPDPGKTVPVRKPSGSPVSPATIGASATETGSVRSARKTGLQ